MDRVEDNSPKEFPEEKKNNLARQIQKQMVNLFAERNLVKLYVDFLAEMEPEYPGISEYKMNTGRYVMRIYFRYFIFRYISMDAIPTTI